MTAETTVGQTVLSEFNLDLSTVSIPKYIAIEGPIGIGKTTLAKRLASSFNYDTLLEDAEENPFLERFYQDQKPNTIWKASEDDVTPPRN